MACPASWKATIFRSSGEMILFFFSNPAITRSMACSKSSISTASLLRRAARRAASLQTLAISAPAKPGVWLASTSMSTPSSRIRLRVCTRKMASRSRRSGLSIMICRSKRPGRSSAESSTSGRFVAAMMMTPLSVLNPSISTRSWLSVFSRSSLVPIIIPRPRERPMASISSMKMMQGAFSLACRNRSRTRAAPTPTNISTKSEPEREKNGTPASPATALARSVLPVPGGPTSSTPFGSLPPSLVNFFGFLRKSTTSTTSSLASSSPATSLNVSCCSPMASKSTALFLPMLSTCEPGFMRRMRNIQMPTRMMSGSTQVSSPPNQFSSRRAVNSTGSSCSSAAATVL